mmetsp:Transcript_107352/g.342008  ORF Transcript_107352/g.342008 Transcript_107352/m.342008 type:complete len:295 (+) Transcript_107352:1283-2167(+)
MALIVGHRLRQDLHQVTLLRDRHGLRVLVRGALHEDHALCNLEPVELVPKVVDLWVLVPGRGGRRLLPHWRRGLHRRRRRRRGRWLRGLRQLLWVGPLRLVKRTAHQKAEAQVRGVGERVATSGRVTIRVLAVRAEQLTGRQLDPPVAAGVEDPSVVDLDLLSQASDADCVGVLVGVLLHEDHGLHDLKPLELLHLETHGRELRGRRRRRLAHGLGHVDRSDCLQVAAPEQLLAAIVHLDQPSLLVLVPNENGPALPVELGIRLEASDGDIAAGSEVTHVGTPRQAAPTGSNLA